VQLNADTIIVRLGQEQRCRRIKMAESGCDRSGALPDATGLDNIDPYSAD